MFSIKRLKEIMKMLPDSADPRIGGSCALYFYGIVDSYRDIDIIVDSIKDINLSFPKIEFIHKNRLNKGIKYCIDGQEVDVLENIVNNPIIVHDTISNLNFVGLEDIYEAKRRINDFISLQNGNSNS